AVPFPSFVVRVPGAVAGPGFCRGCPGAGVHAERQRHRRRHRGNAPRRHRLRPRLGEGQRGQRLRLLLGNAARRGVFPHGAVGGL
ncbi:MAG: hypothetical protein AVDCRST_MAG56-7712, partial [uncultured Cytophagales bacterium]